MKKKEKRYFTQFKNEVEKNKFVNEWEKTRLFILDHLNGRRILITCEEGKEGRNG